MIEFQENLGKQRGVGNNTKIKSIFYIIDAAIGVLLLTVGLSIWGGFFLLFPERKSKRK